jgi:hypothetical protein
VKRVEHREEAFARDGEYSVAALDPELLDKDLAAGACRHADALSRRRNDRHPFSSSCFSFAISGADTPFGGVKDSGFGSEGGKEGLESYQVVKAIHQT